MQIIPHSTSEPSSRGRTKSVSGGAGLLANPRIGARSSVSPSAAGGDVCEESLTALRLFSSSLHGIIRRAASAHAASVGFSAAGTKSGKNSSFGPEWRRVIDFRQCGCRFSNLLTMQTSASSVVHFSLPENRFLRYSFERLLSTPASGYRTSTTGALTSVGTNGEYWSSSPAASSVNAGYLDFNAGNVDPFHASRRSYGFPVRCVQHLQAAFIKVKG